MNATMNEKPTTVKQQIYREALRELDAVLAGHRRSDHRDVHLRLHPSPAPPAASWTGFYRVVAPRLLRVGPYQGPLGCLEIPFDRGVCGAAARERARRSSPTSISFRGTSPATRRPARRS